MPTKPPDRPVERSRAETELRAVLRRGFWRLKAEAVPALSAFAAATFGDESTTSALRRRLRSGMMTLQPTHQDACFTLFGVTDEAADLTLGERRELAGQTPGLPDFERPSTVRSPTGLEEYLLARLLSYFEDGPTFPEIDPISGRGWFTREYRAALHVSPEQPGRWEIDLSFTIEAYRHDIEVVTTALHGRAADIEDAEVLSRGHHKIGTVPYRPGVLKSGLMLAIYVEASLPRGKPVTFEVKEIAKVDAYDPDCSLGMNVARYPPALSLSVHTPRSWVPAYSRHHSIQLHGDRKTLGKVDVPRTDDSPMTYEIAVGEPSTRYAIQWTRTDIST